MRRAGLLVLVLAAAAPCALAAEPPVTRAEEWARLRREKAKSLHPSRQAFLERQIQAIEKAERPSVFDLNLHGLYPRVQNIAQGSETAAGVRLWRPDLGRTMLDLHASAFHSVRGYELYDLQVGRLPHRGRSFPPRSTKDDDLYELGDVPRGHGGRLVAYLSARYRHFPEVLFAGLGSDTGTDQRANFLHQDATYELVAGYQPAPRLTTTLRGGLTQVFVGPGTRDDLPSVEAVFDDTSAPGLAAQPDFLHITASALLDTRDERENPHRGGMLAVALSRFDDRGSGEYAFSRAAADARAYVSLGSPQRVLAARTYVSADRASAGARVPFYAQESLGGGHTLRAYPSFRFRGETVLLFQAEYRWEAWPALELALFGDAGRAFAAGESLALDGIETDVGFGLRLKTYDRLLARFEVAHGREETRLRLSLSPSF